MASHAKLMRALGSAGLSIDWCPPGRVGPRLRDTRVDAIICFPGSVDEEIQLERWIGRIVRTLGKDVRLIFVAGTEPETQTHGPSDTRAVGMSYDVDAIVRELRSARHPSAGSADCDDTPAPIEMLLNQDDLDR